jgi:hypothetical protein
MYVFVVITVVDTTESTQTVVDTQSQRIDALSSVYELSTALFVSNRRSELSILSADLSKDMLSTSQHDYSINMDVKVTDVCIIRLE